MSTPTGQRPNATVPDRRQRRWSLGAGLTGLASYVGFILGLLVAIALGSRRIALNGQADLLGDHIS
ncbi:MAG: hypothetical protein NVSMB52_21490 [Chloroflexota bacterium]